MVSSSPSNPEGTLGTELISESIRYNQAIKMILNRAMITELSDRSRPY